MNHTNDTNLVAPTDTAVASSDPFSAALSALRGGEPGPARVFLDLPESTDDATITNTMINLAQAFELLSGPEPIAAHDRLGHAMEVLQQSGNAPFKTFVGLLANFVHGLNLLRSGDAHGALRFLTFSAQEIDHLKFYLPELATMALSIQATGHLAAARIHLSTGNIALAEQCLGRARAVYDEMLAGLDPANRGNAIAFAEIFGTRIEVGILFIGEDLRAMDVTALGHRLASMQGDAAQVSPWLDRLQAGPIAKVLQSYVLLVSVYAAFHRTLEALLVHRRPLTRDEVESLIGAGERIMDARKLAQEAADRGQAILYTIDQLARQQRNLLQWGRTATQDFGRFSGPVSLGALIVLILVVHFTAQPTGSAALLSFFGCMIAALVAGFGYGALRFKPLLKLFSDAISQASKKGGGAADAAA
jgi:hypothetical protein